MVNQRCTPEIAAFLRVVAARAGADPTLGPEPYDDPAIVTPAAAEYPGQFRPVPAGQEPPFNLNGPAFNVVGVERDAFTTSNPPCRCFAIASAAPPVPPVPPGPPGPPSPSGPGTLPATGFGADGLLPWALVLVVGGALLLGLARRRGVVSPLLRC